VGGGHEDRILHRLLYATQALWQNPAYCV